MPLKKIIHDPPRTYRLVQPATCTKSIRSPSLKDAAYVSVLRRQGFSTSNPWIRYCLSRSDLFQQEMCHVVSERASIRCAQVSHAARGRQGRVYEKVVGNQ